MILEVLEARSRALDEAFFRAETSVYRQRLRAESGGEVQEALARASGITDGRLLSQLASLEVRADTLAAFTLIPLVEVAWADGHMHENERQAILRAAETLGIAEQDPSHGLLQVWLEHRPAPQLVRVWGDFIEVVCKELTVESRIRLREDVIGRARKVAEAAGGFLGVGSISREEESMLSELELAFVHWDSVTTTYPDARTVPPTSGAARSPSRGGRRGPR